MAKKTSDKMNYGEAMAEIEKILASLQSENADVDTLAERVKRASELIAACRAKLRKAESDVNAIFEKENNRTT